MVQRRRQFHVTGHVTSFNLSARVIRLIAASRLPASERVNPFSV